MANSTQRPSWLDPNKPENRALLDTIRYVESGWADGSDAGYYTNFGGGKFTNLSKHPENFVRSGKLASDAAGAYQFLSTTWKQQADKLGLKDFSKKSQDQAALDYARQMLLAGRGDAAGGLANLKETLSEDQFVALGKAWAGLPFSPYGQTNKPNDKLASELNSFYSKRLKELRGGSVSALSNQQALQPDANTSEPTTAPSTTEVAYRTNDNGSKTVLAPGTEINISFANDKEKTDNFLKDYVSKQAWSGLLKDMTGGIDTNQIASLSKKLYPSIDDLLA